MKALFNLTRMLGGAASKQLTFTQATGTDVKDFVANSVQLTVFGDTSAFVPGKTYQLEITEYEAPTADTPAVPAAPDTPAVPATPAPPIIGDPAAVAGINMSTTEKAESVIDKVEGDVAEGAAVVAEFAPLAESLPGEAGNLATAVADGAAKVAAIVNDAAVPIAEAETGNLTGAIESAAGEVAAIAATPAEETLLQKIEDLFNTAKSEAVTLFANHVAATSAK